MEAITFLPQNRHFFVVNKDEWEGRGKSKSKATGLIFSLFSIASAREVPFAIPLYIQYVPLKRNVALARTSWFARDWIIAD